MMDFIELNNLDEVNGGGIIGCVAGGMLGFSYGVAGSMIAAGTSGGGVGTVLRWGWASAMTGGAIGTFLPEP